MQAQMPISARAKTNNNNNSNRNNNPNFVPQQLDEPDSTQNKEPEGIVFD